MNNSQKKKLIGRERRHQRVRAKVTGTSARPRLSIYRSMKHIYAQLIDDQKGHTIASASESELKGSLKGVKAAEAVGKIIAEKGIAKKVSAVVFDRGGYKYHGRIKALADSARKTGLKF